ncbi:30S ribosomal protein S20 [Patescibacteria group bacterium]
MANLKASKKALRVSKRRHTINVRRLKTLRAEEKVAREAILAKDSKTDDKIKSAVKALDKAAQTGTIHKNKAARHKSRLIKAAKAK